MADLKDRTFSNSILNKSLTIYRLKISLGYNISIKKLITNCTKLSINFLIFTATLLLAGSGVSKAQDNDHLVFNPNFIISDTTFTTTRDFNSEDKVQSYLNSKNSPIKNYKENNLTAAQIIFKSARGEISEKYGIKPQLNPALIITMLEKEQSIITLQDYDIVNDPQKRMRSAMGYGCPDGKACDEDYRGFYNQVTWGAFQLQLNFEKSKVRDRKSVV